MAPPTKTRRRESPYSHATGSRGNKINFQLSSFVNDDMEIQMMPSFLLRGRKDNPANEQKATGLKPSVSPSTATHTTTGTTNTAVLEKKSQRETSSPLQFQPPPINQSASSARKAPVSTFTPSKPVAATHTKTLVQHARHDGKGAVGRVSASPSHTSYPIRQYVGGKKVLAQYGHPDNKGAAK